MKRWILVLASLWLMSGVAVANLKASSPAQLGAFAPYGFSNGTTWNHAEVQLSVNTTNLPASPVSQATVVSGDRDLTSALLFLASVLVLGTIGYRRYLRKALQERRHAQVLAAAIHNSLLSNEGGGEITDVYEDDSTSLVSDGSEKRRGGAERIGVGFGCQPDRLSVSPA